MTATSDLTRRSPTEAYQLVLQFAARCGEEALRLAMHAALPQVLRPDLLHLLRLNFVPEAIDDPALEADVLFSPFCEDLGNGYYRFDASARLHLLRHLDPAYERQSTPRSQQVGRFLLSYLDRQLQGGDANNDDVYASYLEVERWVALAFCSPDLAARQLAAVLSDAMADGATAARVRITGLSEALETPLAAHHRLLTYSAAIEAIESGEIGQARDLLGSLGNQEITVGDVVLRPARALLATRLARTEESERPPIPEVEENQVDVPPAPAAPQDQIAASDGTIFISYSHKDSKWAQMLAKYLQPIARRHRLELWDDTRIVPANDWQAAINRAIDDARVVVLLVSADYLASDFMTSVALPRLFATAKRTKKVLTWLVVSPCLWQNTGIAEFQALEIKPLTGLRKARREQVMATAAIRIERLLTGSTEPPRNEDRAPAPGAARNIYLSYRRGDAEGYAGRLSDTLTAARFTVTRAYSDVIGPETSFSYSIEKDIAAATAVLVVIGRQWLQPATEDGRHRLDDPGDFVRLEVAAALRHNVLVIPILVDGATIPRPESLPSDIAKLVEYQALVLSEGRWARDVERLVKVLVDLRVAPRPEPPPAVSGREAFENDLYISYSHVDDEPFAGKRWVSELHENLSTRLAMVTGRPPKVWRDQTKLTPSTRLDDTIERAVRNSALLLAIISPAYLASEYCRRELSTFLESHSEPERQVVKVMRLKLGPEDDELLPQSISHQFFEIDGTAGTAVEFDSGSDRYRAAVVRLAHDIADRLRSASRNLA